MGIAINGRDIANTLLTQLKETIQIHKTKPHLEVILIGNNSSSLSYIRQKQKAAEIIGANLHTTQLPENTQEQTLKTLLSDMNNNPHIHGIILQLPLPETGTIHEHIGNTIIPIKDIDGFVPNTPFTVPVAKAVITILEYVHKQKQDPSDFLSWLRNQDVIVIGKGKTAGSPIKKALELMDIPVIGVDRSTQNPHELYKKAEILISCTGKPDTLSADDIQEGAIVLSVGLTKTQDGITGDYNEHTIAQKASFYTPTPGGVGPVNVACLMQNLVQAYNEQQK